MCTDASMWKNTKHLGMTWNDPKQADKEMKVAHLWLAAWLSFGVSDIAAIFQCAVIFLPQRLILLHQEEATVPIPLIPSFSYGRSAGFGAWGVAGALLLLAFLLLPAAHCCLFVVSLRTAGGVRPFLSRFGSSLGGFGVAGLSGDLSGHVGTPLAGSVSLWGGIRSRVGGFGIGGAK